jgi:hypothetical protein
MRLHPSLTLNEREFGQEDHIYAAPAGLPRSSPRPRPLIWRSAAAHRIGIPSLDLT